ncbi:O-phospho-L-serine:2-oxoglutarate transaminase [Sugiyamaella lignohabitans]|uniref:phosphoserine transaminase n=1 Tax=Sugiyamaella lignohabitans TaxID=796027 RepID=A0A161HEX5_9ASCO|nr:O-phospho-L-serine:2-oxoglutarate transaminase [Sugiyamaella lignohabitans]ANB13950.1 O-phospho-L-serine:2-oxoglutarate transaminase [Sugiyamaella lignohabitans]
MVLNKLDRAPPHYFGAGPALLPTEVLQQAAVELIQYQNLGIGLGEMSHRSSQAIDIINTTKQKVTQLLDVPDTHEVFFAQGGGTGGFAAVAGNLLAAHAHKTGKKGVANYIVTGSWSQKAAEEAERLGADVNIVVDARKFTPNGKYGVIPAQSDWKFTPNAEDIAYVYYCDNETVGGVEFHAPPEVPEGVELVADMSSNFLSKPVDVSKFGLIFGGAQKNIGIAGISLYIIKKSLLQHASLEQLRQLQVPIIPIFLDFPTLVKNNSAYNTLSIFALRIVQLNVEHLLAKGGLKAQGEESKRKAAKIYALLDKHPEIYKSPVAPTARSNMNIVFTIPGDGKEETFIKEAAIWGLTGLKGHRSVGGIRVSNCKSTGDVLPPAAGAPP